LANGRVLKPPKRAVDGLLEWAVNLWPYVNGKAVMNGLQLSSMEASDMLDVIHYLFEEDMRYSSGEQAEAVEKSREIIYKQLYNVDYLFSGNSSRSSRNANNGGSFNDFDDIQPFDPKKKVTKPYIPPTQFDPDTGLPMSGNGLLEAPLN